MKRLASLVTVLAISAGAGLTVSASEAVGARSAAAMPTITLAMTGKTITVGGTPTSGAVNVVSMVTGTNQAGPQLVYLKPGATFQQAFVAVGSHHGDPNYLSPYGSIVFSAAAGPGTSTAQTVLAPGHYVAMDTSGNNPAKWPHTEFTVTSNPAPAPLPAAAATVSAIEFGFTGPGVLHNGQLTRFQNLGFVVHMVIGIRAKNRKVANRIVALLRAGKDGKAQRGASGFASFAGPLSTGSVQQFTLNARPGYWVLACFMDTQDGREHTRLGMERIIRIAK